jgi:ferredoxin
VEASAIAFEMFSKARSATTPAQATGPAQTATVRFDRSQQEAEWQGSEASLLAFAEAQGLKPIFACRSGVCGTCACNLLEGEVAYNEQPNARVADGKVLICISRPKSTVVRLEI